MVVIAAYLIAVNTLAVKLSGRQASERSYFVGEGDLPYWAVCFSIVATETSTLTVISIPGASYIGAFGFVGLSIGYIIGRVLVAIILLPRYFSLGYVSVYQYLSSRFGRRMQGLAALTFLVTRLLAEGVRLFASAIPIKLMLSFMGVEIGFPAIIAALTISTVLYTYVGGIRAVVWTDAMQMTIYFLGAVFCLFFFATFDDKSSVYAAFAAGKFRFFDFQAPVWTSPFNPISALVGGALFSMASHGSDQLIVQRVLSCRTLREAQLAMVGSGILVGLQFLLFSTIGTLLWIYWRAKTPSELGLSSPDGLFPRFIITALPNGVSGLLIAGILAASMGSLSSALNSMANSTVSDLWRPGQRAADGVSSPQLSRYITIGWALAIFCFAVSLAGTKKEVIILGLGITGYAYGALLGTFALGIAIRTSKEQDALIAFVTTLIAVGVIIHLHILAFTWLVPAGVTITFLIGLLSRFGISRLLRL